MRKIFPAKIEKYFAKTTLSPHTKKVLKTIKILFVVLVSLAYLPYAYLLLSFASFSSDSFYLLVCMVLSPLIVFWWLFFYRKYLLTLWILLYLFSWAMSAIDWYNRDRSWEQKNNQTTIAAYSPDINKIDNTFKIVQTTSETSLIFKDQVIKTWAHTSDKNPFMDFVYCDQLSKLFDWWLLYSNEKQRLAQRQKAWESFSKKEQSLCIKDDLSQSLEWSNIGEGFYHIKWFSWEGSIFDTTNNIFIDWFWFGTGKIKRIFSHLDLFWFVVEHSEWYAWYTLSIYDRKQGKIIKEWNINGTEFIISRINVTFIDSKRAEIWFQRDFFDEPYDSTKPEESITLDLY